MSPQIKGYTRGSGSAKRKSAEVDLALSVISAVTAREQPGMVWTYRDIAEVCGVHHSAIQNIAERALRKVRNKIIFSSDPLMRELRESRI